MKGDTRIGNLAQMVFNRKNGHKKDAFQACNEESLPTFFPGISHAIIVDLTLKLQASLKLFRPLLSQISKP